MLSVIEVLLISSLSIYILSFSELYGNLYISRTINSLSYFTSSLENKNFKSKKSTFTHHFSTSDNRSYQGFLCNQQKIFKNIS
jgi:hypothetical protein